MNLALTLLIALSLCSCGTSTTLYQRGVFGPNGEPVKLAEFGSNLEGLSYVDGGTTLDANKVDNAESTRAQNELANNVVDSAQNVYQVKAVADTVGKGIDAWVGNKTTETASETLSNQASEETARTAIESSAEVESAQILSSE